MLTTIPRKITNVDGVGGVTYQLRVRTSKFPKSGIQSPRDGVNIALTNTDGLMLWHRIVPALESIQGGRGDEDMIAFDGMDIGVVDTIWISPEHGEWKIQEIALTTPFQRETFVHEEGVVFTSESRKQQVNMIKYEEGMQNYRDMKSDIMIRTLALTLMGCTVLLLVDEKAMTVPFACGGGMGMVYQKMLQDEVDLVGTKTNLLWSLYVLLNTLLMRMGVLVTGMYVMSTQEDFALEMLVAACLGFFMNKIALYTVVTKRLD